MALSLVTMAHAVARKESVGACLDAIVSAPVGENASVRSEVRIFVHQNAAVIRTSAAHVSKRTMRTNRLESFGIENYEIVYYYGVKITVSA